MQCGYFDILQILILTPEHNNFNRFLLVFIIFSLKLFC